MKWIIFILAFSCATFAKADGEIYLPNIPGYASGTASGGHNGIDVNISSGTVTATNPSVGLTGAAVPTSATYTGFLNGTGNLTAAKVNASQALTVDGSAVTQPVSAASLPLPSGASTSALQSAGNVSLTSILAALPSGIGQTVKSGSLSVTIASDQVAPKTYQNSAGSFVLNSSLTTVVSEACPSGGVGFVLEASSSNTNNIRWALGATATTSSGMRLEPGRDTVYVPVCATISIVAEAGTQEYELTWVKQ